MNRRRLLNIFSFFLLTVLLACNRKPQENALRIGLPIPLTGGSAEYGEFIREGATLAADEINQQGGVHGKPLELIFEDGQGRPAEATKAAEKLILRDHIQVITGAFNSSATLAVAEVAKRETVPMVVGLSTADSITGSGNPYVFRVCASNSTLASRLADYILDHDKPRTIAYIYEKTDFGTNLANVVRSKLEQGGIHTVDYIGVNQDESDFLPIVSKLAYEKPEMVFLAVVANSALPLLRQAREARFRPRWANAVSLSNPKFLQDAGDLAENFIGITHFDAESATGPAKSFVEHFEQRYKRLPTHYSAIYYDTIKLIAEASKRSDNKPNSLLNALRTTDVNGITGHIRFNANGQADIGTLIFKWNGSSIVQLQTYGGS